ncbi:ADP-ribosylglycohydrolase family protein [Pelagicoccus sp. SDUM812002]|uniref:ADP-ribosylglycohydrolase family protein n=1 Tax=Pelagicoccus sp. SDUM812002 TaxID=3041266 RepID=UPI00280DE1BA|nr:ADP-ribosylglycohydrolase family protein [Pelagicoccus sp. SDUM812002]MDQ8187494.1 ADP-ribosylglycohydrolase family protein [Pelagicoccus sp. SDUM812002]
MTLSRSDYADRLHGFWLGQCIANWTGLTTEMDRVNAPFYTDEDWGTPDQENMWGKLGPSPVIDFFFERGSAVWGADDDTDIEYIYQHLLSEAENCILTAEQIRDGWLEHIWSDDYNKEGENYLWVSNENAYELMRKGILPPDTSLPENNPDFDMIDAQLTTEIFGLFAPGRPDVALKIAELPILTTAREDAKWASEFYVAMHSLAALTDDKGSMQDRISWMAERAKDRLPEGSYVRGMYEFVKARYDLYPASEDWEATRDAFYQAYQIEGKDGYEYRQPFDAGINFGASLVSLFYGEGDLKRTIQIGTLAGWDSDNPTATWGGLLGFMLGREGVENAFGVSDLSELYHIHRTRRGFPDRTPSDEGEDSFPLMAERGLAIVDRLVVQMMGGEVDDDTWRVPPAKRLY